MATLTVFYVHRNQDSSLEVDFYLQARNTAVCWSLFEKLCGLGVNVEDYVIAATYIPNPKREPRTPWFSFSLEGSNDEVELSHVQEAYQIAGYFGEGEIHLSDKVSPGMVLILNRQDDGLYRDGANKKYYAELIIQSATMDGSDKYKICSCGFTEVPYRKTKPTKGGMKA